MKPVFALCIMQRLFSDSIARRAGQRKKSIVARLVRSARVLAYLSEHKKLFQLYGVRHYLAADWNTDLFRHLSQRAYLIEGLSVRERIHHVFSHYSFEDKAFNQIYKEIMYSSNGYLTLWEYKINDISFLITLGLSPQSVVEGELTLTLLVNHISIYVLSFNWLDESFTGLAGKAVPFIARSQGSTKEKVRLLSAFTQVFPQNSPRFFCFAAMQGIAQAVDAPHIFAIKAYANVMSGGKAPSNFINSYDKFWESLGGIELMPDKYLINVPFYEKPLHKITSKHRKRAIMRRSQWSDISASAKEKLRQYLKPPNKAR